MHLLSKDHIVRIAEQEGDAPSILKESNRKKEENCLD